MAFRAQLDKIRATGKQRGGGFRSADLGGVTEVENSVKEG